MKMVILGLLLLFSSAVFSAPNLKLTTLEDTYDQVNFGYVPVNTAHWAAFKISNNGDEPLQLAKVGIAGPMDFAAWYDCEKVIEVGQDCRVDIRYWPNLPGTHTGTFIMYGVENKWNLFIRLWGQAYR